jgi:hypothetical protein
VAERSITGWPGLWVDLGGDGRALAAVLAKSHARQGRYYLGVWLDGRNRR